MKSKHLLIFLFVLTTIFFFFPKNTFAQSNFTSGNNVTLEKNQTINDNYFTSGGTVVILGTVNGDVYAAGGTILINGTVNGDILAAGGNVSITGRVTGNVRTVGGQIIISGDIGRDVTAAGGTVTIRDSAKVAGSLVTAGGNISVLAPIGKGVTVAGNMVDLDTNVGGNVVAAVKNLRVLSGSHIAGRLYYWSPTKAEISSDSVVRGIAYHQVGMHNTQQKSAAFITGFNLLWGIIGFISAFIIGLLFLWFVPNYVREIYTEMTTRLWVSFGIGVLIVILVPIAFVILLLTIIGIPLAFLLLLAFIFSILLVKVFVSYTIGRKLLPSRTVLALFVGLIIYTVISIIPIIGGLWNLVALCVGVGVMFVVEKNLYKQMRLKKLV